MGAVASDTQGSNILSLAMSWTQGGVFLLFVLMGTVSGMDPGSSSTSVQLSTLGSQLIQLQEQVEVLQQEHMEDKERIVHLERRVSLLESVCGSTEMETEIPGSLMAIGGTSKNKWLRSAEVLNTSCDFPLPEGRYGHISVTTADAKTLVCGGYTGRTGPTASCLQFNPESKTWENHSSMKSERHFASSIVLSSGLYVLGGDGAARSSSEFLATGSSVWTQGPDIPGSGVHESCAAKLSETEFVILGGGPDGTNGIVYNELTGEWREWPRLTVGVYGSSCVGLGDTVLMTGGWSYGVTLNGRTVIFDSLTGSAREVASLNYPRAYAAMEIYRGKPVILGGWDGRVERSDGEMWNMDTETWEEADIELNVGRSHHSLVTMAEEIDCD